MIEGGQLPQPKKQETKQKNTTYAMTPLLLRQPHASLIQHIT